MAELIILTGKHQGKKLVLPPSGVTIGRDTTCQVRLASTEVSRRHCRIRVTSEGIVAQDLSSRNGTTINDEPLLGEALVKPGDVLRVGPMELQVPGQPSADLKIEIPSISASDNDIAHWLSDEEEDDDNSSGATTIIKLDEKAKTSSGSTSSKKQFKSIAEEAANIIRRHWDSLEEETEV